MINRKGPREANGSFIDNLIRKWPKEISDVDLIGKRQKDGNGNFMKL